MYHLEERIAKILKTLKALSVLERFPAENIEIRPCGYKTDDTPPSDGWTAFSENDLWGGGKDRHAWFRFDVKLPDGRLGKETELVISTGYTGAPRGRKNCIDLGVCLRESMNIPRGERYELCRSVHAETNAIISARRADMIGSTLYLVGRDAVTGELVKDASSCSMCKRQIINAGIDRVVIRRTKTEYTTIIVRDWVFNDDSLTGQLGY